MADLTEKLTQLAALVRDGFMTREEFEEAKQRLMAGGPPESRSASLPPGPMGSTLGAYRILGEIGQGGMGVVYRARHSSEQFAARQGGDVALKVLHAQYAARPEAPRQWLSVSAVQI